MTRDGLIGFAVWLAVGMLFIGNGLLCFRARKATGFWANAKTPPIKDVRAYNRAMGKLWCVYGTMLIVFGIPMLLGSGVWIMASIVGVMVQTIGVMIFYTLKIEKKYRKE